MHNTRRHLVLTVTARVAAGWVAAAVSAGAIAAVPAWKPEKPVELIAPSAPGGGTDTTARKIQKILEEKRLIDVPAAVVNKTGGGGSVALAYLSQHAGNGHYVAVMPQLIVTNYINGKSSYNYTDFTPLALLTSEYTGFAVKTDSPIRTAKDLLARLKSDPGSISIAVGTSLGGANHITSALATQAAGGDVKKLKLVVFKSSAESITALLGGHVDVVSSSVSLYRAQLPAGTLRLIAIAAPRRSEGALAAVPTWKELGYDIVVDNWRAVFGPPKMSQAQIDYWDAVTARLSQGEEWKEDVKRSLWENNYLGSKEYLKYLDGEYERLRRVLSDLGMAKK